MDRDDQRDDYASDGHHPPPAVIEAALRLGERGTEYAYGMGYLAGLTARLTWRTSAFTILLRLGEVACWIACGVTLGAAFGIWPTWAVAVGVGVGLYAVAYIFFRPPSGKKIARGLELLEQEHPQEP